MTAHFLFHPPSLQEASTIEKLRTALFSPPVPNDNRPPGQTSGGIFFNTIRAAGFPQIPIGIRTRYTQVIHNRPLSRPYTLKTEYRLTGENFCHTLSGVQMKTATEIQAKADPIPSQAAFYRPSNPAGPHRRIYFTRIYP